MIGVTTHKITELNCATGLVVERDATAEEHSYLEHRWADAHRTAEEQAAKAAKVQQSIARLKDEHPELYEILESVFGPAGVPVKQ